MLSVLNQYTQNYQIYGLAELAPFNYCISDTYIKAYILLTAPAVIG